MRETRDALKDEVERLARTAKMGEITLNDIREVKLSVKLKM